MPDLHAISVPIAIEFAGTVHLGTGRAEGLIHRTVRRAPDGHPYVPASALKGALRMTAERIIQQLDHILRSGDKVPPRWRLGRRRRGNEVLNTSCRAPHPEEMCQSHEPCIVCRVFGNVFTGERLHVNDAHPETGPLQESLRALRNLQAGKEGASAQSPRPRASDVDILTRLAMDRRRRGAKQGALFTSEYSRPESVFTSTLEGAIPYHPLGDGLPPAELVLLAATLTATDQIGGEASTGHGQCQLHIQARGDNGAPPSTIAPAGATGTESPYRLDELLTQVALDSLTWSHVD
jgi:CRISPR/Cas system CSM-associated protein Csm3 (group 7 of RAMP superfamily)